MKSTTRTISANLPEDETHFSFATAILRIAESSDGVEAFVSMDLDDASDLTHVSGETTKDCLYTLAARWDLIAKGLRDLANKPPFETYIEQMFEVIAPLVYRGAAFTLHVPHARSKEIEAALEPLLDAIGTPYQGGISTHLDIRDAWVQENHTPNVVVFGDVP